MAFVLARRPCLSVNPCCLFRSFSSQLVNSKSAPPRQIFSGIQPTGTLHIGNYFGAVLNWLNLQKEISAERLHNPNIKKLLICVVDLHALTIRRSPQLLKNDTYNMFALLLACGLNPKETTLFIQSHVPFHGEFQWLLGCEMPLLWLNNMTQFKDKSSQLYNQNQTAKEEINVVAQELKKIEMSKQQLTTADFISFGLYAYPLLQAADILLYRSTHVPVGQDQFQHLELTRSLVDSVNKRFKKEILIKPTVLATKMARVMDLQDSTRKMSKSAISEYSRINLTDEPDIIHKKIKKAQTDSIDGITFDPINRPQLANLLNIYSALTYESVDDILKDSQLQKSKSAFKTALSELMISELSPIREEYLKLSKDRSYLNIIMKNSAFEAQEVAIQTIKNFREELGCVTFP